MLKSPTTLDRPTEEQSFRIVRVLAPALCIKVNNNSGESHMYFSPQIIIIKKILVIDFNFLQDQQVALTI